MKPALKVRKKQELLEKQAERWRGRSRKQSWTVVTPAHSPPYGTFTSIPRSVGHTARALGRTDSERRKDLFPHLTTQSCDKTQVLTSDPIWFLFLHILPIRQVLPTMESTLHHPLPVHPYSRRPCATPSAQGTSPKRHPEKQSGPS